MNVEQYIAIGIIDKCIYLSGLSLFIAFLVYCGFVVRKSVLERRTRKWATPLWNWFSLSYAGYVVIPRIIGCDMPVEWQERLVKLMDELDEFAREKGVEDCLADFSVLMRKPNGRMWAGVWTPYRHRNLADVRADMDSENTLDEMRAKEKAAKREASHAQQSLALETVS